MDDFDEETPLLRQPAKATPLPWRQFSIVLFIQLAEPLTSQVIYPFVPQLVRDIGITNGDETQVAYYVGILQSIFFLTQAITVLHWSRLSDHIGRKPVILIGLFGISLSMWCFGLSSTFWGLVLSRGISGALNGNIGVIKSMMVELTDSTNIAQAFAYFPLAWCTGLTLGPIIGGTLSRPAEQFPDLFGNILFLKKFPYFLACAIPATFAAMCWVFVFVFLEETVKNPMSITTFLCPRPQKTLTSKTIARPDPGHSVDAASTPEVEEPLPLRELLTYRVIIAAGNYALLSLCDITFRAIQPVFLSTPIPLGGLGLPPSTIGQIFSIFGILNGIFQVFFFAKINNYWGSKKTFLVGIASQLPVFAIFPILTIFVKKTGLSPLVWVLVIFQTMMQIGLSLSYGSVFIYIAGAAPNKASLGATNGLSQMTVSIFRAIGPAAANSLYSMSLAKGYMGGFMVYYALMLTVVFSIWIGLLLPKNP